MKLIDSRNGTAPVRGRMFYDWDDAEIHVPCCHQHAGIRDDAATWVDTIKWIISSEEYTDSYGDPVQQVHFLHIDRCPKRCKGKVTS